MKLKAFINRELHCLKHLVKGDLNHQGLTQIDHYYDNGIKIKSITKQISCTCGKIFYIH